MRRTGPAERAEFSNEILAVRMKSVKILAHDYTENVQPGLPRSR